MKTRAQIYSHEASGILRDISTYGVLTQKQISGLYPQKDEQIKIYCPISASRSDCSLWTASTPDAGAAERP